MAILLREQLDAIAHSVAVNGCGMPDCGHENHEPVFFFHAKCHIKAQCEVYYDQDKLHINCAKCDKYICKVAVNPKPIKRCHVNAPVEICYREGTGIVQLICNECKTNIVDLEVKDELS